MTSSEQAAVIVDAAVTSSEQAAVIVDAAVTSSEQVGFKPSNLLHNVKFQTNQNKSHSKKAENRKDHLYL